jgi:hypothetical protein
MNPINNNNNQTTTINNTNTIINQQQQILPTNTMTTIRSLVQQTEQVLTPMVENNRCSTYCSVTIYSILQICIKLPIIVLLFLIYILIFRIIDILIDICTCTNNGIQSFVFFNLIIIIPTSFVENMIITISYPGTIASMAYYHYKNKKQLLSIHRTNNNVQNVIIYLIPKQYLVTKKWTYFPKHEDVKDQLKQQKISELYNGSYNQILYVSHKWLLDNTPDTPNHDIFNLVNGVYGNNPDIKYIWFDYTCVPTIQSQDRIQQLILIPLLLKKCKVDEFWASAPHHLTFETSIWCQLEILTRLNKPTIIQQPLQHVMNHLTIQNPNDLYFILPGFIELIFSTQYRYQCVGENFSIRLKIFVIILRYFMKYHDEVYNSTNNNINALTASE